MALPEPSYILRDANEVLKEIVARYESDPRGGPLSSAQVQRLIIDIIVYREMILRIGIQEAAKQNTWRYARYPMIDLLAEILGPAAARLAPRAARTTLRYTIAAQLTDTAVPIGKRVRSNDSKMLFAVAEDKTIAAGQTSVDVIAIATTVGVLGNGFAPGQVTEIVDPLAVAATVTNLTESRDGAAEEDTEAMRARLPDAVATQAAAGPENAYRAHSRAVSQTILDVAVTETQLVPCTCGSTPPKVCLTILTNTGTASSELQAEVLAKLSGKTVRPFTDRVETASAVAVEYDLDVSLVLYADEEEDAAIAAATTALQAYALERRSGLGRAPVDGQIISAIRAAVPAVYNVIVNDPSTNPEVEATEFAKCMSITVDVDSHVEERRPLVAA